jgi:hypothetical protein
MSEEKICFFISPIGSEGSYQRQRSDRLMKYIINPVVENRGYKALRGDQLANSSMITTEIMKLIIESPLVIADCSDQNPNVYYELAVRHTIGKIVILLIEGPQMLPFDIAGMRVIQYGFSLEEVDECKSLLGQYIDNLETTSDAITNPVTLTLDLQRLRESNLTFEQQVADMVQMLHTIQHRVDYLYTAFSPQPSSSYGTQSYAPQPYMPYGPQSAPYNPSYSYPPQTPPLYPPPPPLFPPPRQPLADENEAAHEESES